MGSLGLSVVCEKCHKRYPVDTGRYRHAYLFEDGSLLFMKLLLGHCRDCNGYKYVESIDCEATDMLRDLSRVRALLSSITVEKGLLSSWLVVNDYSPPKPLDMSDISQLAEEIDQIILQQRFLALRTTAPRCMTCGGHNIEVVESRSPSAHPFDQPTLTHPGCGGAMHYEADGHIMYRYLPPIRRYSVEGVFIDEIDPKEEA